MPPTPAGTDIALHVLESTLIGGDVSAQTNQLIHKQIDLANQQGTNPNDMLNLLTALVMGSPEFQQR
jgi:Zn-dependent M16 (insulinase) family peptidase